MVGVVVFVVKEESPVDLEVVILEFDRETDVGAAVCGLGGELLVVGGEDSGRREVIYQRSAVAIRASGCG